MKWFIYSYWYYERVIMLTWSSFHPLLPVLYGGHDHIPNYSPLHFRIMSDGRCEKCPHPEYLHPCKSCLPNPACSLAGSAWSPTYCKFCCYSVYFFLFNHKKKDMCKHLARRMNLAKKYSYDKDVSIKARLVSLSHMHN